MISNPIALGFSLVSVSFVVFRTLRTLFSLDTTRLSTLHAERLKTSERIQFYTFRNIISIFQPLIKYYAWWVIDRERKAILNSESRKERDLCLLKLRVLLS